MSTDQQATTGTGPTEAKLVPPPQDLDTSAANPEIATNETPAATGEQQQQQEEANATSTPSSPKHGSNILANFPNFLKKPFEKKHEEPTEAGDHAVTETSDEAAASTSPNQDKSEKRLSRTLMDMLHKTKAKPENQSEPTATSANNEAEATAGVLSEEQPEGEQTTEHEVTAATGSTPSSPKDTKEPIMDHFRKFFAKKPADTAAGETTTTPTTAATHEDDAAVAEGDHPTVPTDQPATTEESKPTSLSRRFSKMAQNLTTRIKETNKKQTAAKTSSGEGEATTESTANPTTEEEQLPAAASATPATTHTADVEATNTPLPESVSNNGNGLPVPASA